MKLECALIATVCIASLACERDPASNVKIIARPPAAPAPSAVPGQEEPSQPLIVTGNLPVNTAASAAEAPPFKPELCKLQPDTAGSSTFRVKGPCAFQHSGNVKCRAVVDDFYTTLLRKGPGEATTAVYLNVEYFKGPGTYDGGQMFLTVQNGDAYYHWSSDSVKTIVAPGLKYVDVPTTKLDAEPPNTGTAIVSGRLWCASLTNAEHW